MVILLVFMQLTRDLFAIAKFLLLHFNFESQIVKCMNLSFDYQSWLKHSPSQFALPFPSVFKKLEVGERRSTASYGTSTTDAELQLNEDRTLNLI